MRYRKPKKQKNEKTKNKKVITKETRYEKTVGKALGKKYEEKIKKKEKSSFFHYMLKQLGLRK